MEGKRRVDKILKWRGHQGQILGGKSSMFFSQKEKNDFWL